ncbi:hypothetical protein JOB18_019434 [Solea senegalensis]|uniref:Uncharacterized protein n=1 Tax=Solea senegalensis TaxID=28829 RepID=A0AAV6RAP5_SOLSE|nr:hypothetical protein JOB18_019434 [Solea senegalensis]
MKDTRRRCVTGSRGRRRLHLTNKEEEPETLDFIYKEQQLSQSAHREERGAQEEDEEGKRNITSIHFSNYRE